MRGLGPSFVKIWTCVSSPRSGSRNAWKRINNIWNFSARSKWFPVGRDWWTWTKSGYITMTRRQSNSQWSGGIASHPSPKNSGSKNPLKNFSPWFFEIKTVSSSSLSSKGPNNQHGVLLIPASATEGHFERKMPWEFHEGSLVLSWKCPGSPGTCNPEETAHTCAFNIFITHPILQI